MDRSLKEAQRKLKDNLEDMIEGMIIQARLHRAKYDALIAEGFSEKQALELCKTILYK